VELLHPNRHDTTGFNSMVAALDEWLSHTAQVAAAAGTAATWVLCRGGRVVGHHALAVGSVERRVAPSRLGRGRPGPVPILLLARLALDRREQGIGLTTFSGMRLSGPSQGHARTGRGRS